MASPASRNSSTGGGGSFDPSWSGDGPASASDRAAALEAKLGKRRPKPRDLATIKAAHWRRYNEVGKPGDDPTPQGVGPASAAKIADGVLKRGPSATSPSNAATASAYHHGPIAAMSAAAPSPGLIPGINRSSATPTAEQLMSGQKRYETPEEASIRAQRAAMYAQPAKDKAIKKQQSKEERWKAWSQFEQSSSTSAATAPPAEPYAATPSSTGGASLSLTPSPLPSSPPSASASPSNDGGLFEAQLEYLLAKVTAMPPGSVTLIRKILQNLLQAGATPTPDQMKFRKIKLGNPKIQEAVVKVDGGLELLENVGFVQREMATPASSGDLRTGATETYLVFPDGTPLESVARADDSHGALAVDGALRLTSSLVLVAFPSSLLPASPNWHTTCSIKGKQADQRRMRVRKSRSPKRQSLAQDLLSGAPIVRHRSLVSSHIHYSRNTTCLHHSTFVPTHAPWE